VLTSSLVAMGIERKCRNDLAILGILKAAGFVPIDFEYPDTRI